jgi:hypothetical protein
MAKKLFTIVVARITGDISSGNSSITNFSVTESISNGYSVGDIVKGVGIPFDTRITNISGTTITLDKNATQSLTGETFFILTDNIYVKGSTGTDTVGGYEASEASVASTVVARDINKNINVDSVTLTSATSGAGKIFFDDTEKLPQVKLNSEVTMNLGGDIIIPVYNATGSSFVDGQAVYSVGTVSNYFSVELALADDHDTSHHTFGIVTQTITSGSVGYVTMQGVVSSVLLDPAVYSPNDILYLSPTVLGGYTNVKPISPNQILEIGWVKKVSSDSSTADGEIYVKTHSIPLAQDIVYDNSSSNLNATNLKVAIDELDQKKVNITDFAAALTLYPTSAAADVSGYYKLVLSVDDADYDNPAVDIPTGAITAQDQLLSSLVSTSGVISGNPGTITISTIGNVRKTSGNSNQNAFFYFKIFVRDSSGVETELTTSNTTQVVSNVLYNQFYATAVLPSYTFLSTDRIVFKYYGSYTPNTGGQFEFQFGGNNPVRSNFPVPISVIPADGGDAVTLDTTNFNGVLQAGDDTVQKALDRLDDHNHDNRYFTETESDNRYLQLSGGTISGNLEITGTLKGPSTFTIDPSVHGDDTGTVVIKGNLQVDGTTTTLNSTVLEVDDKDIVLASGAANSAAADGAGILIGSQSSPIASFTFDNTTNSFQSSIDVSLTAGNNIVLSTNTDVNNDPLSTFDPSLKVLRGNSSTVEILWKETDLAWKVKDADNSYIEKKIAVEGDTLDGGTW